MHCNGLDGRTAPGSCGDGRTPWAAGEHCTEAGNMGAGNQLTKEDDVIDDCY